MGEVNKETKMMSTGDLAFLVVTKIIWFVLAIMIAIVFYREMTGFFYNTLELQSRFWAYTSALLSFMAGTVFNWVYDGAF